MTTKAKPIDKKRAKAAPPLPTGCEALLSRAQICAALGMSMRKFQGMLSSGEFPGPDMLLGRNPRWRVKSLNAWIEARCRRREH